MRLLPALVLAFASALPAAAETPRRPDAARLLAFDASFGHALRRALAEGDTADVQMLTYVLAGGNSADWGRDGQPGRAGDWSCRTIKLGEAVPIAVYGNFRCRIERAGTGWRLTKLTGSQRMTGLIGEDGVYTGVAHVNAAPDMAYSELPPEDQTPQGENQTVAQVGLFEQMAENRARLLMPLPILESEFDILYLSR